MDKKKEKEKEEEKKHGETKNSGDIDDFVVVEKPKNDKEEEINEKDSDEDDF